MCDWKAWIVAVALIALAGCAGHSRAPLVDSRYVGQPLIRDADGRITGFIDEKQFGPTYIRAIDGRILGTIEEGPGSAPTRIRDTDGRILYEIDSRR